MTSTYRGRVTNEVTDIPLNASDGKVQSKTAICVYTHATSTSTQVIHFIHDPPKQGGKEIPDQCPNQNDSDTTQNLDQSLSAPESEAKLACEAEEKVIVSLETLTAVQPAI